MTPHNRSVVRECAALRGKAKGNRVNRDEGENEEDERTRGKKGESRACVSGLRVPAWGLVSKRYHDAMPSLPELPEPLAKAVAEHIHTEDIAASVDLLRQALNANTSIRVPGKNGAFTYEIVEDWRSRIAAAKLLIEFKHGKAAQHVKHSGTVGHIHATQDELIAIAAGRIANTERVVREYLPASDASPAISVQEPAPKAVVEVEI